MVKNRFFQLSSGFFALSLLFPPVTAARSDDPVTPAQCESLRDEIEQDFIAANWCESDEDCTFVRLGGWYIDFGCYKFIHVSTNAEALLDKISRYKDLMRCSDKINDCMHPGAPVCIDRKCVGKKTGD